MSKLTQPTVDFGLEIQGQLSHQIIEDPLDCTIDGRKGLFQFIIPTYNSVVQERLRRKNLRQLVTPHPQTGT